MAFETQSGYVVGVGAISPAWRNEGLEGRSRAASVDRYGGVPWCTQQNTAGDSARTRGSIAAVPRLRRG